MIANGHIYLWCVIVNYFQRCSLGIFGQSGLFFSRFVHSFSVYYTNCVLSHMIAHVKFRHVGEAAYVLRISDGNEWLGSSSPFTPNSIAEISQKLSVKSSECTQCQRLQKFVSEFLLQFQVI